MLLKSVKLENIRSYLNQEIEFNSGSTLLSGDIGSGKSSILLAIEFALFGIRGKRLSGETLLRNGKNEGGVELKFELENENRKREIIVKRKIKRSKESVGQASGYIIKDGIKKEGTATEIKSEIINLLGYPKELVSKTKNLVYRYTVYTPQEEMKNILVEDPELRLDTLRKVFGIDKYKKISENCIIITRNIKERRKELEGKADGLEKKKKQKEELTKNIEELEKEKKEIIPFIEEAKKGVEKKKEEIKNIEEKIKELNSLKQKFSLADMEEKNKHELFENIKKEINEIKTRLERLRKEVAGKEKIKPEILDKKITQKEDEIVEVEKILRQIDKGLNELNIKKKHAEEIKSKILKISRCPTCEQEVEKEYKDSIIRRENNKIEDYNNKNKEYAEKEKENESKLAVLKKELEKLKDEASSLSVVEMKKKEIKEKEKRKEELVLKQKETKKNIGKIYLDKKELDKRISELKDVEEEYKKLKQRLDKAVESERKFEIKKVSVEKEAEGIAKNIKMIEKEIREKKKSRERFNYLGELLQWLEEGFIKLAAIMEKQVMLNVHSEFNELFQNWFGVLMEDETINVRLDDSFTPVVEQNGYEISIENLSGGERTSAALAYRLALNKVVNDLMEGVKTRDLIILDEPTDGFSSEQLDRVREVLEEIGTKQTIIVSHENKIESFVNNVIKVNKNEHISEIT
ncbi:AAA family ATPase [Candidatus Woesearchaeota archaeon]|nr:AAA family ATPase [Candidatus Woesearchaeota archaeon]